MPLPIPAPRESGTTRTTPVPLAWVRYGPAGAPPLVLLHGGPGADHRYLLPQMLHLAERYEVVTYDQRGSGGSRAGNNTPITWQDHVADLAAVARELGLTPLSLVGYSWGGLLAMLYAVEAPDHPERAPVARMVLVSPAPVTSAYRRAFDAALRERTMAPALVAAREALMMSGQRQTDPDGYRQRLFELGVAGYFADPAQARDLTPFRVVGRVQDSTWASLGDFDLRSRLGAVHVPTLIVHGRDDPIPAASSHDAARALGAELVLLDHSGHVPYVECPEALWGAVDPFLVKTDADVAAAPSGTHD